ncbi:MAG: prenyltransferase/squalene oxidase repeat-containing protein [Mariniblastus sp.]
MPKTDANQINLDQNILNRFDQLDDIPIARTKPVTKSVMATLPRIDLSSDAPTDTPANSAPGMFLENTSSDISQTSAHRVACAEGDIWVSGSSLLCACPDCSAPMTIRMWLRLADCWRCSTSITLSEEQLKAARQLKKKTAPVAPATKRSLPLVAPPVPSQPTPEPVASAPTETEPTTTAPRRKKPLPPPPPAFNFASPEESIPTDARTRELEELSRGSIVARVLRNGFRLTPAWMVSFLIHLMVILILALIVMTDGSILPSSITLSTFLNSDPSTGGDIRIENTDDALRDDLAVASDFEKGESELRNVLQKANNDAKTLQVDNQPLVPLPNLAVVKENITTRPDKLMSFAARDPRVRAEIVRKAGGTTITEAAVARGIRWLASVQNQNGGWSLADYQKHDRKNNKSDIMGTSLALLPMLGAGQTHEFGAYKQNVAAGLAWLIDNQKKNGDLRAGYAGQAGMYAHGQGAIVLCEALALTGDEKLKGPAQRAIRFIELAQHGNGGWRYKPLQVGDTSVFGWQMMALQSARAPDMNLEVDDSTLRLADYFLDQVVAPARFNNRRKTKLPKGAAYAYQPRKDATPTMTAEAILCRMYLGWKKDDPRLDKAVQWLIDDHMPEEDNANLYYWYYGTQVMHHYGGKPWEKWNETMRRLLISTQETRGKFPGSWNHRDFKWGPQGGRIYTTSLAVCTLEVYYRHLPLFKQIDLDE